MHTGDVFLHLNPFLYICPTRRQDRNHTTRASASFLQTTLAYAGQSHVRGEIVKLAYSHRGSLSLL